MRTVTSPLLTTILVFLGAVGGLGGAFLLGWIAEESARAVLSASEASPIPDLGHIIMPLAVLVLLGIIGNFVLCMSFTIQNPIARWVALGFSVPVPILIEIIDLPLRFFSVARDFGLI